MSTNDHEIKIGDNKKGLRLIIDEGRPLYSVIEDIPNYQQQLRFIQQDWTGGHGQYGFEQPDMFFEGQSIDTTQEGRLLLGPKINSVGLSTGTLGDAPSCFCWFNSISKLMVSAGAKVYWYDDTNLVLRTTITGKTITWMADINDVLYVCIGSDDRYYYTTDGTNFTQTDLTNGKAERIFAAPNPAATATVLWLYKAPNELRNTTNGKTVAQSGVQWSSIAYIGDSSNDITNIFLVNDNLMQGKEDKLWHYDSDGGTHPLMNDLEHNRSATNFKYVVEYQTGVYFSLVTGLGKISSYNAFSPVGPLLETADINKEGTCVGLASETKYIFAAMDEGTNTHIYKGQLIRRGGVVRWEWCPWISFVSATYPCAIMKVIQHSATDRRLWFGYGNYAAYVILSDNPTETDSSATFASTGWIRGSYIYGTNPYWDKMFQSIVTETKSCATGKTVTTKYRRDTDTSATVCAPDIKRNGIRYTNLSNQLDCKRIQFELHLATDASGTTPEVLYFEARGMENPEVVRIHEATYAIGTTKSRHTKTMRDFLRSARTSKRLVKFADLRYGESIDKDFHWVVMQPGYPREPELYHEKGRQPELGIMCRWQEVSFSE